MATLNERSVDSTATPEAVWAIWSDTDAWPTWNPDVTKIRLDGPLRNGATGVMTTAGGRTHDIVIGSVDPGREFVLETRVLPGALFQFVCRVQPSGTGRTRISQGIRMRGPLAWLYAPMMGARIAQGFDPLLRALAGKAEQS
jgi:uncharacterized protein YndB with AHSA1/START domain